MERVKEMIDYLFNFEKRIISPIWDGEKAMEFMCLGYNEFAEALNFKLCKNSDKVVGIDENELINPNNVECLRDRSLNPSTVKEELDHVDKLKKTIKVLFGGGFFGPLTVAGTLVGMENFNKYIVKNPDFVESVMDFVTKQMIYLAKEEEKHGIDFLWIAEPVASLLSPKSFEKFCGVYLKRIFDSIKVPGFLHVCGKTLKHTNAMVKTGAKLLSIDYVTDIEKCIRIVPDDVIIMGNINPMLLKYGDKQEIINETIRINEACKNYKNFIFSTGCILPEGTPKENVELAIDTTENFKIWTNEEYIYLRNLIKALVNDDKSSETIKDEIELLKQSNEINKNLIDVAFEEVQKIRQYSKELM